MRGILPKPIWIWVKVLLCLAAVDVLVFWTELFWRAKPNFGVDLEGQNWSLLYGIARRFEIEPAFPGTAFVMGSSVVRLGVSEPLVNATLRQKGLRARAEGVFSLGASCTDTAILAKQGMRLRPWLVIYVAAARDFAKAGTEHSPVIETFYDSSIDLPLPAYQSADSVLWAHIRRYWKLYRYRFFARTVVASTPARWLDTRLAGKPALASDTPGLQVLPPEARWRFHAMRVTPQSFAQWERWRESRRFDDYLDWIRANGSEHVLSLYKTQTLANFGPQGNRHWFALQWMLEFLRRAHTRVVLIYAPENPVFHDPAAKPYFDESLSRAWAQVFANQAEAHGARFVDLRTALPAEDFYDLIHPNLAGMRKLSARIATIIVEEWHARVAEQR